MLFNEKAQEDTNAKVKDALHYFKTHSLNLVDKKDAENHADGLWHRFENYQESVRAFVKAKKVRLERMQGNCK